jgi:hypothetical protein
MNAGPWPVFIGVATDPKAFQRELDRLGVTQEVSFLGRATADATTHHLISPGGQQVHIITIGKTKGRTREQVAGLVAHEAMHVIQNMQDDLARGERLGMEAEAYLMQMIVQECLQMVWSSRFSRRSEPAGDIL